MSLFQYCHAVWRRIRRPASLGQRGERAAEKFLRRAGYTIVARGQRDRLGELDLVAVEGRTIVFVEVKTRSCDDHGTPAEAVNREKQRRLTNAALSYLKRHDLLEYRARFDVIAITWSGGTKPKIEHFQSAFEPVGKGQMFS